ncbi:hypothetical protein EDC14_103046 [Hydrogenispora ethanolica]|uniref:Uncharacterized protein n=1 Tax=Hydrogenispora ethanolica TaxID=1082276 RepID=A0A4R1R8F9_HYDET|nr:hypothetical protein [Hydrogenispora ethanolica]TCL61944.1 hypothetical protein EDC14_103046 [Hydrogenispora ethanolica]
MVYIAILGAILVLIGNNTRTAYSRPLVLAGMVVTVLGLILMWVFREVRS